MATTLDQLATRVLQKLAIVAANEAPSAADQQLAIQKLHAAQEAVRYEDLLRWSAHDVPLYAQEPLVLLAASLAAPEFDRVADPGWTRQAMVMIARAVNVGTTGTVYANYF